MIELYFIYNGHRKILIGSFGHIHSAINELKQSNIKPAILLLTIHDFGKA